jgi:hypothetical protein
MGKTVKKAMDTSRAEALEQAYVASRLLDEKYYADFSKAIRTKDKALFDATCKKAKIPEELAQRIWAYLSGQAVGIQLRGVTGPVW